MGENAVGVHNVMEDVVRDMLSTYKGKLNLTCDCDRCLDDIMSLALNDLPPRYIANANFSPVVRAPHEADVQGATNMISVITRASGKVSSSPRCETFKMKQSQ